MKNHQAPTLATASKTSKPKKTPRKASAPRVFLCKLDLLLFSAYSMDEMANVWQLPIAAGYIWGVGTTMRASVTTMTGDYEQPRRPAPYGFRPLATTAPVGLVGVAERVVEKVGEVGTKANPDPLIGRATK